MAPCMTNPWPEAACERGGGLSRCSGRRVEVLLHIIFSPFAKGGELFDKAALAAIQDVMRKVNVLQGDTPEACGMIMIV